MTAVAYKLKTKFNDNSFKLRVHYQPAGMKLYRDLAVALLLMVLAVPTFTDVAAAFGGVSPKKAKTKNTMSCMFLRAIDNEF